MADPIERKVFIELECGGLPEFVIEGRALDALLAACLEASGVEFGETIRRVKK